MKRPGLTAESWDSWRRRRTAMISFRRSNHFCNETNPENGLTPDNTSAGDLQKLESTSTLQLAAWATLRQMGRKTISVVTAGVILLAMGCGKRVPIPSAGTPGTPHVGWVIMVGDRDNPNRDFVCQSDPRTDCVIPASRPGDQAFTDVHFYFHPAKADATYRGTILIPFFEGSTPHELKTDVTVKQGDAIANSSVSGIVPSKAGTYPMTIQVTVDSGGAAQQIRDRVPVVVK